ncbi:hypothetical protein DFJ73DRAFT_782669 [Zopfochytrium polystomum]|nr:hypothetical protein DFJ73DRAFT_782669 [Zopfochytrium polystomum]
MGQIVEGVDRNDVVELDDLGCPIAALRTIKNMVDVIDQDEARLKALGYKQEVKRELSIFTDYGVSLSVACVVSESPRYRIVRLPNYLNETGITSDPWVILVCLLLAQFTLTGRNETRRHRPSALSRSLSPAAFYILALLFSIQDYDGAVGNATGLPIVQVLYDATGKNWTLFLVASNFFYSNSGLIGNSRMIFAFSRDGAINKTVNAPVNAPVLAIVVDCVLILPYLRNTIAFTAITSITTIGLYISYLGVLSKSIGFVSLLWVAMITALFVLPSVSSVTRASMNCTCVMVGAVVFGPAIVWVVSPRHWFTGPSWTSARRVSSRLTVSPTSS